MRRKKYEVTDFNTMIQIIDSSTTVRLGFNTDNIPYIVPLSFGYEVVDGTIILYVHSASEGHKVDLISKNSQIKVEFDNFIKYYSVGHNFTCSYNSLMAEGKIEAILDDDEKLKALNLLLNHCDFSKKIDSNAKCMKITNVYKITLSNLSCKVHD
ncbi:hypothetical protein BGI41_02230 [Methanobrevibacter sp. 87.7]|uniref:pyridoxamine 5'-phosphate oxidase family protein n=1 Tax=Methanobrevibacter sp. 87.7 TaxID=387957 RepID=UPI000B50F8AE|nr:pyridoxamine 5'-phosphate oxidase family protein [Methanobrevibacter sp. 87.7]OWT33477.1 hypothetical protein BGI41_02230 [Methanobrevibacter sp. 87.7]